MVLDVLASAKHVIRQEKEITGIQIKEEIKLLYLWMTWLYGKSEGAYKARRRRQNNPITTNEWVWQCCRVQGKLQKLIMFLYTSNGHERLNISSSQICILIWCNSYENPNRITLWIKRDYYIIYMKRQRS